MRKGVHKIFYTNTTTNYNSALCTRHRNSLVVTNSYSINRRIFIQPHLHKCPEQLSLSLFSGHKDPLLLCGACLRSHIIMCHLCLGLLGVFSCG